MMDMRALYDLVGDGKIFSAKFIKRTTGEERVMLARVNVKKYLKGDGSRSWNPFDKQLLPVYEMTGERGYKFISADSLIELKVDGIVLRFDSETESK